jgi:DNA-binding NarL/FixJ family response regulator
MSAALLPFFATDSLCVSSVLRRTFSNLTSVAIALLDDGRGGVTIGTLPSSGIALPSDRGQPAPDPGKPVGFVATPLDDEDRARLDAYGGHDHSPAVWSAFRCQFESGRVDTIAVRVEPGADEVKLLGFLSLIWPVLREDCLNEIAGVRSGIADEALLWMIAKKMDVAVFVVNAKGMMLRSNSAAIALLDHGVVLQRTRHGIACKDDTHTRMLRDAIAACATSDPKHADAVIFLPSEGPDHQASGGRVPVTLSRFLHDGEATSLVTMMLPSPPDSRRVETLAREMGLTQAEARVAALLQLGLSNRDAAKVAGLTEQSLSTYAKRVLSKLNVTSRAEMAQMLTWQSQGGRMT